MPKIPATSDQMETHTVVTYMMKYPTIGRDRHLAETLTAVLAESSTHRKTPTTSLSNGDEVQLKALRMKIDLIC
jgi:hypothetical protein